ncbi:TspO/MBR family protein [Sphingomonas morindae]|uniref:Tryptophan-rich sensory protein n=1 Tax=Sphingomonas morindae TaxID=1541170 RepID=A0ABY4X4S7_9SPHN|nr:TspO/MBR family protein [Sphingomonas morindae]USI71903.1 tryptophan-rich sensory protein [Sphingomonas morindae]
MSEIASIGQLRMSFLRVALFVVPAVLFLGIASGVVANSGYANGWFAALAKPRLMPPAWVFPVAWTSLYILIGLALAMIVAARRAVGRGVAIGLFCAQFALNLAWSPLFFAAHQIAAAFFVILLMIALTIATLLAFARIRRRAALLMLPYLGWLCFAAWLNHAIDILNPDANAIARPMASTQIAL